MSWKEIVKSKKYPQWDKLGMQDSLGKAKHYAKLLHEFASSKGSIKNDKSFIRQALKKVGYGHINLDFLDDLDM
tara:strand:- start:707 stop:928 length:222 start_codon:yes stop_codon:yes gene_type:complete